MSGLDTAGMTAGSIEGAGSYILGSKALTVGSNNMSTTVSGVISGIGGSRTKVGTGTLILSGANPYTGMTNVNAGVLQVDGSLLSPTTTVNNTATLTGIGSVQGVMVNNGGIFAPGSGAPGTSMTVNGNLAFQSGALYLVQLNPSTASLANVTGAAALAGTVQAVFAPGAYVARNYTILHSGGLGGTTFGGLTVVPPNFSATLSYTATDVILNLTAQLGLSTAGLTVNQQNVANALNNFFNGGGALPPNFAAVFGLTGAPLANALTLLSGEPATGAQQGVFQLNNQFLALMLDPFVDGRTGAAGGPATAFAPERASMPPEVALAYASVLKSPAYKAAPYERHWTFWSAAYGGYNRTQGDPVVIGSHDFSARAAGIAAGADYRISRDTVLGLAVAGGGTNWTLTQGLGGGRSDAFQAGAYGATRWGPAFLAASLVFANHWMSTDRFAFAGDHLAASFAAQSFGARLEGGWRFAMAAAGVTPYGALQAQTFRTPRYSETDLNGGGFALTYAERSATATRSELGTRFDQQIAAAPAATLALRGKLAWAHDWISNPSLSALFQGLPGASFIVNGAAPAKNLALASAGAELRLANGITFIGKFDGEFANRTQSYAGTGTLRYTW